MSDKVPSFAECARGENSDHLGTRRAAHDEVNVTKRLMAAALAITMSQRVLGAPVEVQCYWRPPLSTTIRVGTEAARFFPSATNAAYFKFDADKVFVENSDSSGIQKLILKDLSLTVDGENVEINVGRPNIKGIMNIGASLVIRVNRYSLQSIMLLTTYSKERGQRESLWLREGTCNMKKF